MTKTILPFIINGLLTLIFLALTACQTATPATPPQWHWTRVENGLPRHSAIVLAVAINPLDPQQLWAGSYAADGLLTSIDGGQSWQSGGSGLADNPIFDLLATVPPDQGRSGVKLWAATRDGLFMRDEGQEIWQRVSELPPVAAFALASDAQGRLYVGLDGYGVYTETDQGDWRSIAPENAPLATAAVISLAVADDGQIVYAGTSGQGVFASRDGGQSWQGEGDGLYGSNIALNPADPEMALASLRSQVIQTDDGGQSWQPVTSLPLDSNEATALLWLDDETLRVGTSQGLFYGSLDGGASWIRGGTGLPSGGVLDLAFSSQADGSSRMWAAAWNGLYVSDDQGQSWFDMAPSVGSIEARALLGVENGVLIGTGAGLFRWQADTQQWLKATDVIQSGGVQSLARDPSDPQNVYAGSSGAGMLVSRDGGATWQHKNGTQLGIPALVVNPANPNHLYKLAAWERVYESYDGGQNWQARWDGLGDVLETVSLAVDPAGDFVYVGTEDGLFRAEGSSVWDLTARALSGQSILALLTQPHSTGDVLYIGTTRGIYRSFDHGVTVAGTAHSATASDWGQGLEHISVTALLADPNDPKTLLAGTAYHGVYQSLDEGQSWTAIGPADLNDTVIETMAWSPDGDLFIAAANGVWWGVTP